jgi:predicted transcriptional regulator YdeE
MKEKEQFSLMGISVRTSNANEMTEEAKIPGLWERYYGQEVFYKMPNLMYASATYGLYSDYVAGVNGEYTLTVGFEVNDYSELPKEFAVKTIPAAKYMVFTSEKGSISEIVFKLWQDIWRWFEQEGAERTYTGDFEVYDERCLDTKNAQVDIYIAIKA